MNLDQAKFEGAVLKSHTCPTVVYFSTAVCAPCQTMKPIVKANCEKFGRELLMIDASYNRELVSHMNVRSVPTLIRFENGKEVSRLVGAKPESVLEKFIA